MKNTETSEAAKKVFWLDWAFYIALAAGPLCWLGIYLLGQPLLGPPAILLWLKLALLMPLLEEIIFRGGVQSVLIERKWFSKSYRGISVANIITSIVFAAMHLISQPPMWAALVFVPSLVFGWARDRYITIVPSFLLHAVYNAGFIWLFVA